MVAITFIAADGTKTEADVAEGISLMEGARNANVPGVVAECGGACACSTCHVYIDADAMEKLPAMDAMEEDMLDFAYEPDPARSRLSCQVKVSAALDGLTVHVPEKQA